MANDRAVDPGLRHWARDAWRCPGCGRDYLTFEEAETCCEKAETCCENPRRVVTCCAYDVPGLKRWDCLNCGRNSVVWSDAFEEAETCCEPYRTTIYQCGCGETYSVNAPKGFREHVLVCSEAVKP